MSARILAFINQKGGVGKTTSAVNIGSLLAREHNRRVLLIDLDPQGNLSDHFGIDPNHLQFSLYHALIGQVALKDIVHNAHGVDILPGNLDLAGLETHLATSERRESRLAELIQPIVFQYDYILIDCPPSLGLLTVNALTVSDAVIVPMQAEYLALRGLTQLMEVTAFVKESANPSLEIGAVLFCNFSPQTILAKQVKADVDRNFKGKVLGIAIRKNVRLAEAPSHGLPIDLYDAVSTGAADYRAATSELAARFPPKPHMPFPVEISDKSEEESDVEFVTVQDVIEVETKPQVEMISDFRKKPL